MEHNIETFNKFMKLFLKYKTRYIQVIYEEDYYINICSSGFRYFGLKYDNRDNKIKYVDYLYGGR